MISNFVAWLVKLLRSFASWIERLSAVQRPIPGSAEPMAEPIEPLTFTPEPEPEPTFEVPAHDALAAAFFGIPDVVEPEEVEEILEYPPMPQPEPIPEPAPRRRRHPKATRLQLVQTVRNVPAPAPFPAGLSGSMVGGTFTPRMAGLPTFSPVAQASATVFQRTHVLGITGSIPFP